MSRASLPWTSTSAGRGNALYSDAIDMPYAPALKTASRSPRTTGGRCRSLPKKSLDSQMGPTTSTTTVPGNASSRIRCRGAKSSPGSTGQT